MRLFKRQSAIYYQSSADTTYSGQEQSAVEGDDAAIPTPTDDDDYHNNKSFYYGGELPQHRDITTTTKKTPPNKRSTTIFADTKKNNNNFFSTFNSTGSSSSSCRDTTASTTKTEVFSLPVIDIKEEDSFHDSLVSTMLNSNKDLPDIPPVRTADSEYESDDDNSSIQPSPITIDPPDGENTGFNNNNTIKPITGANVTTTTSNKNSRGTPPLEYHPQAAVDNNHLSVQNNTDPNSVQSSSSTLPTQHFSTPSSASSSITVDSVGQNNISSELDLTRQYWSKQQGVNNNGDDSNNSMMTNQGYYRPNINKEGDEYGTRSASAVKTKRYNDFDEDFSNNEGDNDNYDDDDEEEASYKSKGVKSFFPNISFYKPLNNRGPGGMTVDTYNTVNDGLSPEVYRGHSTDDSDYEREINHGGQFYDTQQNFSNLSFDHQSKTEADLVSRSSGLEPGAAIATSPTQEQPPQPPHVLTTSTSTSSFKKSLASPVKTIGKLTKRSSLNFTKKKHQQQQPSPGSSTSDINSSSDVTPPVPSLPRLDKQPSFQESLNYQEAHHHNGMARGQELEEDVEHEEYDDKARMAQIRRQSKSRGIYPRSSLPPRDDDEEFDNEEDDDEEEDDTLLPLSPMAPPERGADNGRFPVALRSQSGNKVMTKSQLDSYRKSIIEGGVTNPDVTSDEEDDDDDDEADYDNGNDTKKKRNNNDDDAGDVNDDDDDDDDDEKKRDRYDDETDDKKQSVRMRLKQDAHLSVYRQKMSKVTGSQTALSSYNNSNLRQSQSFGNIEYMANNENEEYYDAEGDVDDEDEYEDVPLGILQAHGFPANSGGGGRLKSMQSQPNLAKSQNTPSVFFNNNIETRSLRSETPSNVDGPQRPDRQSQPPLPAVFSNGSTPMNRGLIGEIAKEEEAKLRRRSVGNALGQGPLVQQSANIRSSTILPNSTSQPYALNNNGANSTYSQSFYGDNNSGGSTSELQQQMMQMMQMQMQMLEQINNNNSSKPKVPAQVQPSLGGPQQPRPYSSFNHYNNNNNRQTSSFDNYGRPTSVRSHSPSDGSSQQSRPSMSMPMPPNGNGGNVKSTFTQETHKMMRPQSQPLPNPANRFSQHQTSMRIVQSANIPDDDDDDEDDEGWEEMLEKRRNLKEMWKKQTNSTNTNSPNTTNTSVAI